MKRFVLMCSLVLAPATAMAEERPDAATIEKIEAMLASIECQMDPDDIEVEEAGYDLDDVICKGGDQFDITLDKDLNEIARRAE